MSYPKPKPSPKPRACPQCGMPIRFWEHFHASAKLYKHSNRDEVGEKPFYLCRTCGFFLFTNKQVLIWEGKNGEWIPFKREPITFIFR